MKLSPSAQRVLENRYLLKKEDGTIETVPGLLHRVAEAVSGAEPHNKDIWEAKFYELMDSGKFLPNSPTLMNAGTPLGMLSACFVLPIDDSMRGILQAQYEMGMIHKFGGGTGMAFSRLRPEGDLVSSTQGQSSGPVSFISMFNATTEAVWQGGKRRGASMGILKCNHPDIRKFIHAKSEEGDLRHFNLSIAITDEFMRLSEADGEMQLINPKDGSVVGTLNAKELLREMAEAAWKNGEPGVFFIDEVNRGWPEPEYGPVETSNPCGEQPLCSYGSCNLGSINLSKFDSVDSDEFRDTVWLAVRFLDDVVSVNKYPLPQIEEVALSLRPIGLGVMGFADYLIQKGIRYDSSEAIAEAEGVARTLRHYAFEASEALGKEKGFYKPTADRRNCEVLSIAPTGTISIIAGCSPSIEPWFDKATLHSYGKDRLDITSDIARDNPSWVVTAAEVSPTQHIHIQAAFQKYVDSGVSKTINLPFEATVEDIEDAFRLSWRLNCKGLTVYRDRSRREQVLYPKMVSRERATTTHGVTTKYDVGCGHIYVTVNSDEKGLCEVFATVGKGGGCPSQTEGMSRLVSLCLRAGVNPSEIVRQLKGIRCFSTLKRNGASALSCPDAVARALSVEEEVPSTPTDITCPECGSPLSAAEGCRCCIQCGWSRCG